MEPLPSSSPRGQELKVPGASPSPRRPPRPVHMLPTSPTKATTLHLSPRKFQQLQQQQRHQVLRGMLPLSPISPSSRRKPEPAAPAERDQEQVTPKDAVLWNPAWLPFRIDSVAVGSAKDTAGGGLSYGTISLDAWLQSYDKEILQYESLEKFIQVKLPEALAFCEKMEKQLEEAQARDSAAAAGAERSKQQQGQGAGPTTTTTTTAGGPRKAKHPYQSSAMARFPVRFRIAVFANIVERTICAMTESAALAHLRPWLFQARQELFRAVFADYDPYDSSTKRHKNKKKKENGEKENQQTAGSSSTSKPSQPANSSLSSDSQSDSDEEDEEDEDSSEDGDDERSEPAAAGAAHPPKRADLLGPSTPRSLAFFLSRVPFILKLQDDSQRRSARFQRHQVVLRRIVQSLYRSLGTVFHAWKMHVRQKKEERLNDKGAQLTAMVVMQRGLVRNIFVEWSKFTLKKNLQKAKDNEIQRNQKHHDQVNELYKELFLVREGNKRMHEEIAILKQAKNKNKSKKQKEKYEEDDDEEDDDVDG